MRPRPPVHVPLKPLHVAVVGAGALGRAYGVRLARRSEARVSFVVRPARISETAPMVLERVRGDVRDVLEAPIRIARVPDDADVVLLTVATNDLDGVEGLVRGSRSGAPVVVLTPTMPSSWARLRDALGPRALAAMPSVVAYVREDGTTRMWLPPRRTLVSEPGQDAQDAISRLAAACETAGVPLSRTIDVHGINMASTVGLIGVGMAIAVAGSLPALRADAELLELAAGTCRDGAALGERLGAADPGARMAATCMTGGLLRLGLAALQRASPEAGHYAEAHFGKKLVVQHRAMIREMAELAAALGTPNECFEEMARRLDRAP